MKQSERINDTADLLRAYTDEAAAGMWTAMPAKVASVDMAKQTISAQPMIKGKTVDRDGVEADVSMPLLVDVPLLFPRGGGFACTVPVVAGDEVLIVFASRCIDGWWQSGAESQAIDQRSHDLSDGFAVLAPTSQPRVLANVQTDGIELRTEDRGTYIKVTNGTIYIKGNVIHVGNNTQTGDLVQTGNTTRTGTSTTSGLIAGAGGMSVNGGSGVSMTGTITHTGGSITSNGVNIGSTHTHSGVVPGGGNTGGPQ